MPPSLCLSLFFHLCDLESACRCFPLASIGCFQISYQPDSSDPVEVQGAQRIAVDVMFESALRSYIPKGVLERVDAGRNAWLGYVTWSVDTMAFNIYSTTA